MIAINALSKFLKKLVLHDLFRFDDAVVDYHLDAAKHCHLFFEDAHFLDQFLAFYPRLLPCDHLQDEHIRQILARNELILVERVYGSLNQLTHRNSAIVCGVCKCRRFGFELASHKSYLRAPHPILRLASVTQEGTLPRVQLNFVVVASDDHILARVSVINPQRVHREFDSAS